VGDRRADLEELYRRRATGFQAALATVVGGYDEARDVVQDAFAVALRDLGSYRGDGPLEAWVMRIALRLAIRRRQHTRPHEELEEGWAVAALPQPERDPVLAEALRALSPRRRLVVFLHYYADLSYAQIAEACNVKEGTVAAALAQARAELHAALETEVIRGV
jgi:RNA polymerase sigma-70 factor, ECF subfamily